MNGGRRPGRAALLRGAPSGHGGLRPPLRRTLLPVALPLLLFLWARPALANDGPIVGVLLARGEADLAVGSPQQALRVEAEGLFETLPRGLHTLQFAGAISGIGSLRFAARPFRFRAGAGEPTQVGDRRYEGWIEVLPGKTGKGDARRWRVVNRLPLEQYLLGVLPREMSASTFPAAALEAQAIAARTYALYHIFTSPRGERVHLRADSRSQVYGGRDPHPAVTRAVERTRGRVLLSGGKLFESYYHSTCGGATFRGADAFGAPRIAALEPVSCGACTASPYYRWSAAIPVAEVTGALASLCERLPIDLGEVLALEPLERGPGGHAAYLRVVHSRGSFEIDAMRFRDRCSARGYPSLRSTSFAAKRAGGEFRFEGRGWGHGVGMCQMGAKAFAERRANARWILNHYYPSSEVVRLWD